MNIGDYVYHKGIKANGWIAEVDPSKSRDKYRVIFNCAKDEEVKNGKWLGHTSGERKWQWCSRDKLIVTPRPTASNTVAISGGNKFMDLILRNVSDIRKYHSRQTNDVVFRYGASVRPNATLVLNENLIPNKFNQQRRMGTEIGIESMRQDPGTGDGWIIKPFKSIGGKNIRPAYGDRARSNEYYQRNFNKVREFRAHTFLWLDNQTPLIQEKYIEDQSQLCWNKKQGGVFKYPYQPTRGRLRLERETPGLVDQINQLSVTALKRLNYDFGGVDIGMDANGNLAVFEVNSRVGLREQTLFTYKAVLWALGSLDIPSYLRTRWES